MGRPPKVEFSNLTQKGRIVGRTTEGSHCSEGSHYSEGLHCSQMQKKTLFFLQIFLLLSLQDGGKELLRYLRVQMI
jgi:hypothetical protein